MKGKQQKGQDGSANEMEGHSAGHLGSSVNHLMHAFISTIQVHFHPHRPRLLIDAPSSLQACAAKAQCLSSKRDSITRTAQPECLQMHQPCSLPHPPMSAPNKQSCLEKHTQTPFCYAACLTQPNQSCSACMSAPITQ